MAERKDRLVSRTLLWSCPRCRARDAPNGVVRRAIWPRLAGVFPQSEPAKNVGVQCGPHLSFGPVPPLAQAPKRGALVSIHEISLQSTAPPLKRENVLKAVVFKSGPLLVSRFLSEQIFDELVISWLREGPAPYRSQHLRRTIVCRDRHHCLHQSQFCVITHGEEITLLAMPPFTRFRDVPRLCGSKQPFVRVGLCVRRTHLAGLASPFVFEAQLRLDESIEEPEAPQC